MIDQSEMLNLKMLEDMIDATSSPVSDCGITHCNSQNGVIDQCGQEVVLANRFPLLEDKKLKQMTAIYGPNGSGSSASAALQKSLESKLRQQLPTGGLTMFIKGWNRKATPLGRLYFQLAVSARPIEGRDYGLWATPNTMDGMPPRSKEAMDRQFSTTRKGRTAPANLREQVVPAMWPTVNASDHRDRGSYNDPCIQRRVQKGKQIGLTMIDQGTGKMESGSTVQTENKGSLNPEFPCWLMGIPNEWVSSIVRGMQSLLKSPPNSSEQLILEDMMS